MKKGAYFTLWPLYYRGKKTVPNEREFVCTQQQFCVFGRRETQYVAPEESRKHMS
jgi:hypothetical protein